MGAMIDLTCKKCRRRFGYRHGQEARCYHCQALNDASEIDALMVEIKDFEGQRDAYEALQGCVKKAGGAMCTSVIRRLSFTIGADPEDVIAFMTKATPLPASEIERVRAWMAGRV